MEPSRRNLVLLAVVVFSASLVGTVVATNIGSADGGTWVEQGFTSCNVLEIPVRGDIVATAPPPVGDQTEGGDAHAEPGYVAASDVAPLLRAIRDDSSIKAVIVDVDSYGGSPSGAFEIADAIRRLGKPSVAVIHEAGLSAGYLIAAAADTVVANDESMVGSIGITSSFLTNVTKNAREGVEFHSLSSGPFKDTFSPDKPLTAAERELIMRDVRISHANFVAKVAQYRSLPTSTVERLADGSSLMGRPAQAAGLIDQIGFYDDALAHLEDVLGESVVVCQGY